MTIRHFLNLVSENQVVTINGISIFCVGGKWRFIEGMCRLDDQFLNMPLKDSLCVEF